MGMVTIEALLWQVEMALFHPAYDRTMVLTVWIARVQFGSGGHELPIRFDVHFAESIIEKYTSCTCCNKP